jgi:DNA-directed RNA polymerase specialized sigma24 family protein
MPMSPDGSVTLWLEQIKEGDAQAAQALWERYFRRLVGLARKKLQGANLRMADEEDVVLSAFDSFCRNAERGCFPLLNDRDGLWRLLAVLTARKAAHLARDENRLKRGGAVREPEAEERVRLEDLFSREPTPEQAAQVAEEYQRLLAALEDSELVLIAVRRMEGHSVEEIARQLGYVPRSIKRKLRVIRAIWEKQPEA